jgi:peptidoglycan/xylan/chitin deacetylase (PgdA/CDA1 family)
MGFKVKIFLAYIFDKIGISKFLLWRLGRKLENKYIRVINYHNTKIEDADNFRKQISYLKSMFDNISYDEFKEFIDCGKLPGSRPGIMLTFDDGLSGNYDCAYPILQTYEMTGYFMVSSDLIGKNGYMTYPQLRKIKENGHVIGCHTSTHHRMNLDDTEELLNYEIVQSKKKLEENLDGEVEIFCWCGGEEVHYTKNASDMIKAGGYKYSFMTNSFPVIFKGGGSECTKIQRINVESNWPIYLLKFQICGFMDWKLKRKRKRVNDLLE